MYLAQTQLSIDTAPREINEITAEVAEWTERQPVSVGLLSLYIPHTSASLLIQENASPDVSARPRCVAAADRAGEIACSTATMTKGPTTCRPISRAR
jgi:hypothetical protein